MHGVSAYYVNAARRLEVDSRHHVHAARGNSDVKGKLPTKLQRAFHHLRAVASHDEMDKPTTAKALHCQQKR
jgi:hypothetical protein